MPLRRIKGAVIALSLALPPAVPVLAQPAPNDEPPPQFRPTNMPLDEVGYAGLSGGADHGAVTMSHRTLPVPSYAEVTSLATGRTILVLVDRRGPDGGDHLVDLSCGAAQQLGLSAIPAPIRVRAVSPPEQERATLAAGRRAAARLDAPEGLLSALRKKLPPELPWEEAQGCTLASANAAPRHAQHPPVVPSQASPPPSVQAKPAASAPAPKPAPAAAEPPHPTAPVSKAAPQPSRGPGYAIQVAALSNRAKADAVARSLGGYVEATGSIYRVRKGPYASDAAARAALPQIRAKGFADARVVTNEGR